MRMRWSVDGLRPLRSKRQSSARSVGPPTLKDPSGLRVRELTESTPRWKSTGWTPESTMKRFRREEDFERGKG